MSTGGAALQPTFQGHVATTQDALILFEACLQGHLSHVPRRPHDRERSNLIRSGSVFIYEENASGIKRWTDGVTWSPSRILGNFLVYRELDKPFPPGEKKRAMKKQQRRPSRPGEPYPGALASSESNGSATGYGSAERTPSEVERQLIGSLIDSYGFKADGLVKKTMSVTVQGVTHHLVSYYNVHDVIANNLRTPSQTENLQYIRPRPELTSKQSFRSPLEEAEEVDGIRDGPGGYRYPVGSQGYVQDYRTPYQLPQYYPPMSQPPAGYSGAVPSMQPGYMQAGLPAPHMPGQRQEYSQYDQAGYNRGFETKSLPPTSTAMPPMMSDRPQQQQQQQNMMYPPSNLQRPMNNMSPNPMDSRNNMPYRPNPYSMTSTPSMDGQRQSEPSPVHMKYEDRRDSGPQNSQMYPSPRPGYYGDGAPPQMHQAPYTPNPPQLSQWPSQGHPQ